MKYVGSSVLLLLLFAASVLTIGFNPYYAHADGSLDGKSFSITYKDKGETKEDVITFKDGEFFSVDCEQYGFSAAPYEIKKRTNNTIFKSTLLSETEGKVQWSGIIDGEYVLGKFVWTKESQKAIIYKFDGSLIKKEEE